MKLSLMVADGVHKGKLIPIPVPEFVIGRDENCQLRPSSPAVSKRHCAIHVKGDKVFLLDFGSTNGTFVNDEPVVGETEVKDGDKVVVGPLVFQIKVAAPTLTKSDSRPGTKPLTAKTPPPKEDPGKTVPAKQDVTTPATRPAAETGDEEAENLAAMLLGTDDGPSEPLSPSDIPAGTTVFDVPAVGGAAQQPAAKPPEQSTSSAADAILRKYMRRPRA